MKTIHMKMLLFLLLMERTPLANMGVDDYKDTTMNDDHETTMTIKCDHGLEGKNEKSAKNQDSICKEYMDSKYEKSAKTKNLIL